MSKVKRFLSTKPQNMTAGQSLVYTGLVAAVGMVPLLVILSWDDITYSIERRKLKKVQKEMTRPLLNPIVKEEEAE